MLAVKQKEGDSGTYVDLFSLSARVRQLPWSLPMYSEQQVPMKTLLTPLSGKAGTDGTVQRYVCEHVLIRELGVST